MKRAEEQGFILIAVLGMIMLLSLIAAFIAGYAEQRLEQTLELRSRWQQQLDQQATLATVQHVLLTRPLETAGWRLQPGDENSALLTPDGRLYDGIGDVRFSLQDEGSLLSLLQPDEQRWQRLLKDRGWGATAIEQWLDRLRDYTDHDDLRRLNGAARSDYLQQGLEPPPQRFMISPGQVFNLLGAQQWRDPLYALLPLFTTRSGQLHNLNTMPALLLATLPGVDSALAQELEQQRQQAVFTGLRNANQRLGKLLPLDEMQMPTLPSDFVRLQLWPEQAECRRSTWIGLTLTPTSTRAPWEIDYVFDYRHPQSCPAPVALVAAPFEQ